jgi:hypothetical protein
MVDLLGFGGDVCSDEFVKIRLRPGIFGTKTDSSWYLRL